MNELAETRRMLYGASGLLAGVVINRIAGLHVILHHLSVDGLSTTNEIWLAVFCVGMSVAVAAPLWFWVVRPTIATRASPPRGEVPR
ncbi:MAG: hypothetical protein ABEJ28_02295 [Salinigranum sp.]